MSRQKTNKTQTNTCNLKPKKPKISQHENPKTTKSNLPSLISHESAEHIYINSKPLKDETILQTNIKIVELILVDSSTAPKPLKT